MDIFMKSCQFSPFESTIAPDISKFIILILGLPDKMSDRIYAR